MMLMLVLEARLTNEGQAKKSPCTKRLQCHALIYLMQVRSILILLILLHLLFIVNLPAKNGPL